MLLAGISFGCGGGSSNMTANVTVNTNSNANSAVKIDTANMPEGLNPNPITPGGTPTPGIPANLGPLPKGATPTPGIPDPATLKKPMKPGLTPTPGIPSPEELRRQLGQKPANPNTPANSDQMMMRKNTNKIQNKPQ